MEKIEHVDEKGRRYSAHTDGKNVIIVGPPEGLVDELGLPEPFATTLHNVLYTRGLWSYEQVAQSPGNVTGALQEALLLDVQKLIEAYFKYDKS